MKKRVLSLLLALALLLGVLPMAALAADGSWADRAAAAPNDIHEEDIHTASGSGGYNITMVTQEGGSVKVKPSQPFQGTTVTISVTIDPGYILNQLTVTDDNGDPVAVTKVSDTEYTFSMPGSDVAVLTTFRAVSTLPFADVGADAWFYAAVEYVYKNGMMNGITSTRFGPNTELTRSMIVTVLWRLENKPQADYLMTFSDVAAGQWYTEAVRWAAAEGIVTGYADGTFGPSRPITREQLAAIFYRYAQYKDYDVSVGEDTNLRSYLDVADVSEYAISAFQWACGSGVINGVTESTLVPAGTATRAQVAAMLMRFCEAVAK